MTIDAGDEHMGAYVYCASHLRPHCVGWCTVDADDKIRLVAADYNAAVEECIRLGLHIFSHREAPTMSPVERERFGYMHPLAWACEGRHYRSWLTTERRARDVILRRLAVLKVKEGAL